MPMARAQILDPSLERIDVEHPPLAPTRAAYFIPIDLYGCRCHVTDNAWAVGIYATASSSCVDLLEYWNGNT